MMHPTQEAVAAEVAYRHDRIKREFRANSKWSRRRKQRHKPDHAARRKWQLAA